MAEYGKPVPRTTEERQAVTTVHSTRIVYGEILRIAEIIKEDWRPAAERNEAKHALVNTSERLCNLMSLALYQVENNTQGELRDLLTEDLDELKTKLMGLGAKLMTEKLEQIDQRATEVLKEPGYPLGLAGKLDLAFANLMSNLGALGGAAKLGGAVPDLVAKTETDLKSLGEVEAKLGVMLDIQPANKRRS